jgi:ribosomal protein L10
MAKSKTSKGKNNKATKPSDENIVDQSVEQNETTSETTESVETKVQAPVLDLTKLSSAQLKALRDQLKEKSKETVNSRKQRFELIDKLLSEKDEDGNFLHTTREIAEALAEAQLTDTTQEDWHSEEIKKIQARKQFLEKKTDEKGELVHPEGTFGYKKTATGGGGLGFSASKVKLETILAFFKSDRVAELNDEQKAEIISKLNA